MERTVSKEKEFKDLVHIIRGQQVMLDSDLAELYGYEVKNLNRQVNRNSEKFPDDFMFKLTSEEYFSILKCHFGTSSEHGGRRKLPYVFTEQGIYMLATVLKGDIATQQSIYVIREFREMRHYLIENKSLLNNTDILKLSNTVMQNKEDINGLKDIIGNKVAMKSDINKIMENFIDETSIKQITILNGHKFEANEAYISIYKQAKHTIYLIDDYLNIDTLSLLKNKNKDVEVVLYSDNKGTGNKKLREMEIENFNKEYPIVRMKKNHGVCHDRYILLDYDTVDEKVYHCGSSSKDAGSRICTISQVQNCEIMHIMMETLRERE